MVVSELHSTHTRARARTHMGGVSPSTLSLSSPLPSITCIDLHTGMLTGESSFSVPSALRTHARAHTRTHMGGFSPSTSAVSFLVISITSQTTHQISHLTSSFCSGARWAIALKCSRRSTWSATQCQSRQRLSSPSQFLLLHHAPSTRGYCPRFKTKTPLPCTNEGIPHPSVTPSRLRTRLRKAAVCDYNYNCNLVRPPLGAGGAERERRRSTLPLLRVRM